VICQAHTGQLGKNNRNKGGVNRVDGDWAKMSEMIGNSELAHRNSTSNFKNHTEIGSKKIHIANENQSLNNNSKMENQKLSSEFLPFNEVISKVRALWQQSEYNELIVANQESSDPLKIVSIREDGAIFLNRKAAQCNPLSKNAMKDLYEIGQWKTFNLKTGPFSGTMKQLCETVEFLRKLK